MTVIRKARPSDAPAMARVIVDTWFATHASQVSPENLQARREVWGYTESERGWRRAIGVADDTLSQVLVATSDEQVIAIVAGEVTETGVAEVGALYVDVPHQRSGTGRRLLATVSEHFRGIGISRLRIAVLAANQPARRFYERLGGIESGTRDDAEGLQIVYTWDLIEGGKLGSG